MHASLQRKFSFSYIAIILAVLILLNTYPLITSENLTFRSKQSSLQGSVSVMVTALSGLEELSEENVAGAMTLVEETGISRVLVTDASGRVLYDTRETDGAIGRYAFYTELVQALRGEDVFYTEFSDKAFKSRAASPGHLPQPDHRRGVCLRIRHRASGAAAVPAAQSPDDFGGRAGVLPAGSAYSYPVC